MASADEKSTAEESRAALDANLARQREIALGKRIVNTQGPESIGLADEMYQKAKDDDALGWMA